MIYLTDETCSRCTRTDSLEYVRTSETGYEAFCPTCLAGRSDDMASGRIWRRLERARDRATRLPLPLTMAAYAVAVWAAFADEPVRTITARDMDLDFPDEGGYVGNFERMVAA